MRNKKRLQFVAITCALLFALTLTIQPKGAMAATPLKVNLGTAQSFAILAGSTITNTSPTTINGNAGSNVGLHPGTVIVGETDITLSSGGAFHKADAVALLAKNDLITAYNDAEARTNVITIPSELGGKTITPGVYDSADGSFQITGTLTLDGQGDPEAVFIFKTASTLITAGSSSIVLTNSAGLGRTFWKVGSSATLGVNSHFVGQILAKESITVTTGATVQGQLFARDGAVTLDSNTITNDVTVIIPSAAPTVTPVVSPTVTPTVTPVVSPTITPTITPTVTPTVSPEAAVTAVPTEAAAANVTIEPTPTFTSELVELSTEDTEELPKTGSFPFEILFGMGALISGSMLLFTKKK